MNVIIEKLIEERKGHYCHCLEVSDVYELESTFESIINEFEDNYTSEDIQEFIDTLQIYYLGEDSEEEERVYNYKFNY
jgi:hypothetical protein